MKAIILAAGRGSRMGALTDNQHKCRILLHGKSLIEWQMETLKKAGIKEIAIVRGYLAKTFKFKVKYFENSRWAYTNMVMSLRSAEEWLSKYVCIVAYSDILYSGRVIKSLMKSGGNIVISYNTNWKKLWDTRFNDPLSDAETFRINNEGLLLEIGNQPKSLEQIEGQYMGLLKFTPRGWQQINDCLKDMDAFRKDNLDVTALLNIMVKQFKLKIHTVPSDDWWFEIDNGKDLSICETEAKKFLLPL